MRAAVVHVIADAAVSVLVIVGLSLARAFGWLWMDPLAGIIGACVIASWSYGLIRDTGAILLDMNPDKGMADEVARSGRGRGRHARRPASVAAGAGTSRRDRLGRHQQPRMARTIIGPGSPASNRCRISPSRCRIDREFRRQRGPIAGRVRLASFTIWRSVVACA